MTDDERRERGRGLLAAMRQGYGQRFPMHVLWRMCALIGGDEVLYADARVDSDADTASAPVSGEAIAITATRVVHATFTGAAVDEPERGTSTATCRAWSRSGLRSIETVGSPGEHSDWNWYHQWAEAVPSDARLRLLYEDGTRVDLPVDPGHRDGERVEAVLPGLLSDLDSTP